MSFNESRRGKSVRRNRVGKNPRHSSMVGERLESRVLLSVDILSYHNDAASTGQNLAETLLTPTSVNTSNFGKRYSTAVDGQVYAQPLYVSQLNVTGGTSPGVHNVVFVATQNDSLYAIDGDSGAVLYKDSFINASQGITTVPSGDVNSTDIYPQIGITSTPVIDRAAGYLFIAAKTKQIVGGNTASPHYLYTLEQRQHRRRVVHLDRDRRHDLHQQQQYLRLQQRPLCRRHRRRIDQRRRPEPRVFQCAPRIEPARADSLQQ